MQNLPQMVAEGVQLLFLHWNVPARQCRCGHVDGSSDLSLQSGSPSPINYGNNYEIFN